MDRKISIARTNKNGNVGIIKKQYVYKPFREIIYYTIYYK